MIIGLEFIGLDVFAAVGKDVEPPIPPVYDWNEICPDPIEWADSDTGRVEVWEDEISNPGDSWISNPCPAEEFTVVLCAESNNWTSYPDIEQSIKRC